MEDADDFNPYLAYVSGSFFAFVVVNYLTRYTVPPSVRGLRAAWKWRNAMTSLTHSVLAAIWAPLAFWTDPDLGADMANNGFSRSAHVLVGVSIGYFLYDAADLGLYTFRKRSTRETLLHHAVVVGCFWNAAAKRKCVAYAAIYLLVEINSVFLHLRKLMLVGGVDRSASGFRIVALLNLVTHVLFRVLLLGWMAIHGYDDLPASLFAIGTVSLACIVAINAVAFRRVISADFLGNDDDDVHAKVDRIVNSLFGGLKDDEEPEQKSAIRSKMF